MQGNRPNFFLTQKVLPDSNKKLYKVKAGTHTDALPNTCRSV